MGIATSSTHLKITESTAIDLLCCRIISFDWNKFDCSFPQSIVSYRHTGCRLQPVPLLSDGNYFSAKLVRRTSERVVSIGRVAQSAKLRRELHDLAAGRFFFRTLKSIVQHLIVCLKSRIWAFPEHIMRVSRLHSVSSYWFKTLITSKVDTYVSTLMIKKLSIVSGA